LWTSLRRSATTVYVREDVREELDQAALLCDQHAPVGEKRKVVRFVRPLKTTVSVKLAA
jgi:hypothetical protein